MKQDNQIATPGPWAVLHNWPHRIVMAADRNLACGASIHAYDYGTRYARQIALVSDAHNMPGNLEPNARIIASAPETAQERDRLKAINAELVKALEQLATLGEVGMRPDFQEWITFHDKVAQVARAVLAKVKGD